MDEKLVRVDLRQHGVQMHEGAGTGDIQRQHAAHLARLVLENIIGQPLDGLRHGALGDADGDRVGAEVQDIAALEGVRLAIQPVSAALSNTPYLAGEVLENLARIIGVIVQDIVSIDRLAVACDGVHVVQGDAAADGREGVAREIEVRDRLKHEVRAVIAQRGQRVVLVQGQLVEADARHGLADELARVGAGQQKLREGLAVAGGHAAAAADKVLNEAAAQAVAQGQRLRGQIGKIDDLHAAVAQHLRKAVMLCLRAAQVGNVTSMAMRIAPLIKNF